MQRKKIRPGVATSIEELCRRHGLALTIQRRLIFATLADRRDHPTADQVYEAVMDKLPGISRTTVYRVLETLARIGAITKVCHPGAAVRYDPLTHRHHHLVCLRCGTINDFEDRRLDRLPSPRLPAGTFQVQDYCVHFRGVCANCAAGTRKSVRQAASPQIEGERTTRERPHKARNKTERRTR